MSSKNDSALAAHLAANNTDPNRIQPPHGVTDTGKLDALAESMSRDGWVGAPVVVVPGIDYGWGEGDPIAVTGSHRIRAAIVAGIDVPIVNLDDILREQGMTLGELGELHGFDPGDEAGLEEIFRRLPDHLPVEVVDYFGLDLH